VSATGEQRSGYLRAAARSLSTSIFLLRIILPLSFAVGVLDWLGVLRQIGAVFEPLMQIWRIPGEAAVVLVSGWLVGIYGAVAAMAVLPLTADQITILAVLSLTAHNLVVESAVQDRTGTPWWQMILARLLTAALLAWIAALALARGDPSSPAAPTAAAVVSAHASLESFLLGWARSAGELILKIVLILLGLMLLTEWMRRRDVYRRLARVLRPLLRFLGLADSVAFLWITAAVLGLAYGSGLLMEEAKEPGRYRPDELRDLNVSIGVCHSLIEDSALLVACGASLFWITVPRLLAAALAVRVVRILGRIHLTLRP